MRCLHPIRREVELGESAAAPGGESARSVTSQGRSLMPSCYQAMCVAWKSFAHDPTLFTLRFLGPAQAAYYPS